MVQSYFYHRTYLTMAEPGPDHIELAIDDTEIVPAENDNKVEDENATELVPDKVTETAPEER